MLSIVSGGSSGYCDGRSRRNFLKLGALGVGGISLVDLFRAEAAAGVKKSHKALINIHLGGGPSHQDMFDLKPDAPVEFRGEFNPIRTNVSGIEICEHMPMLAKMADKFALVRSIIGSTGSHSNFQTHTGFGQKELRAIGGHPAVGSVVAKLQGATEGGAPPFISYNGGSPGFLGPVFKPYRPTGSNLKLNGRLTVDRLSDRTSLLRGLDRLRREADASGQMDALDSFTRRAVDVVTSGEVGDALDINKEDPKIAERYGKDGKNFLLARRLVSAGVRVVTFNWGGWDTHSNNFTKLRTQLPKLDRALSALIEDLHGRGMDRDVTVVLWGEFGRTPRVNKNAGRDHWRQVMGGLVAGGGMNTGQVIGSTSRYAEQAKDRPVHLQSILATFYHNMGIDTRTTQIVDPAGRPQYLLDHREPLAELV